MRTCCGSQTPRAGARLCKAQHTAAAGTKGAGQANHATHCAAAAQRGRRVEPSEQRENFVKKLSLLPKARIFLECRSFSWEAQQFAKELLEAFKESGFETEGNFSQHELGSYGERIQVNSVRGQPTCAGPIQNLLNGIGFNFVGSEEGGLPTNTLRIIIFERKP